MKTARKNTIITELEAMEAKFKSMPTDNNGNPVDWTEYHRQLTRIESLEAELNG